MLKTCIAVFIASLIGLVIALFGMNGAFTLGSDLDNVMSIICYALGFCGLTLGAGITIGTTLGDLI